jgi:O-antigen/teichoic acid export membrane protein
MTLLMPLATLRYELALPLCRTDDEARSVLATCFAVVAGTSLCLAGALLAIPARSLAGAGPAAEFRLFIPAALLAFGTYTILVYEASRVGQYDEIARTRVSQAAIGPVLQILFGVGGLGTAGLLAGFVLGLSSGSVRLWRRVLGGGARVFAGVSLRSMRAAAVKFRRFALFSSWSGVLAGSASLGNIVFTLLYGATVGGYLFLADRILMQPLRVSGNAFLQVFVGEAGRALQSEPIRLRAMFADVFRKQAMICCAWLGAVYAGAHVLVPLVFGAAWAESVPYIDVMLIGYLPMAAAIPTAHALQLIHAQRLSAALETSRFAALVVAITVAQLTGATPLRAALAYSLVQAVANGVILVVTYVRVRQVAARPSDVPGP